MADRNYHAEMRAVIDEATGKGPYVSAIVAQSIVDRLVKEDLELIEGWLWEHAPFLIRHVINLRDASARTHARMVANRRAFAEDAEAFEGGDANALAGWLNVVHVTKDGIRKRLGDMNSGDLTYVAEDYDRRAQENAMHGAFLKALAARVGNRTVADVFDDATLTRLWASLSQP